MNYSDPVYIGNVPIPGRALLAPLAGVADGAFRHVCREFGASLAVSEMVSAKALTYRDKKSALLAARFMDEAPYAVQLFGSEPEIVAEGARIIFELVKPELIDINMGCPAPKITSNGEGSALMRNIPLAARIIEATARAVPCPVTVKLRSGWDSDTINAPELAIAAETSGAAALTVHGRTRAMQYSGSADRAVIAEVKRSVKIPVIANGDVFDGASALAALDETGCDAVMVGRGSLGAPWVFRSIRAALNGEAPPPEPDLSDKLGILSRQTRLAAGYKGEFCACREARKHAAWYLKGFRNASVYRGRAMSIDCFDDLDDFINMVLSD